MKVLVGLGNPGPKYIHTRHNTGFLFLDALVAFFRNEGIDVQWEFKSRFKAEVAECKYKGSKVMLLKPHTYMNESGWSVSQFLSWHKANPNKLLLIHDDLDIPLGKFKMNTEKSPKVHYGIMSVEGYLHTKHFPRLRIGVDNRQGSPMNGVAYVMGNFSDEEQHILQTVFQEAFPEVLSSIKKGNEGKAEKIQTVNHEN